MSYFPQYGNQNQQHMQQQQQNTDPHNPNGDMPVVNPPEDSISSIDFSPVGNFLAAGAWNNEVRFWEVDPSSGQSALKNGIKIGGPVLDVTWSSDGASVFAAGADKTVVMWSLQNNQTSVIGMHDAPVRKTMWLHKHNMLVTGSWDATLRYWDLRQQQAAMTVKLPERLYALDATDGLLVAATADRSILSFDMNKLDQPFKKDESPLKMQTRSLAIFTQSDGFAVGSVEGRVGIHYYDLRNRKNFAFKCHRHQDVDVYGVNAIVFNRKFGTFATCGSDGGYTFWDKDSKQRLKQSSTASQPITDACFNADCSIFAYSLSYDWSKGLQHYNKSLPNNIMLHAARDEDWAPRPKTA